MSSYTYRNLWESINGPIPHDNSGRTYEIHHKDGNKENNDIKNLLCVSIQEHYDIHYRQGDYGACVMIAKRMNLPSEYLSEIQRGKKRPGVGGVKKGTIPWNKGKTGYPANLTEEGKLRKIEATKKNAKISDILAEDIRKYFIEEPTIQNDKIGKVQGNGLIFTYKNAFCISIAEKYKVTPSYIRRILERKSKIV